MTRFSPFSGTASAMVAMAAILRKLGSSFVARALGVVALEQRLRQFERDGGAAERFFGIAAARLVGIEDRQRRREGHRPPTREVMVGDDEVEAEAPRGFGLREGAHARVHGDDEAHAFGIGASSTADCKP